MPLLCISVIRTSKLHLLNRKKRNNVVSKRFASTLRLAVLLLLLTFIVFFLLPFSLFFSAFSVLFCYCFSLFSRHGVYSGPQGKTSFSFSWKNKKINSVLMSMIHFSTNNEVLFFPNKRHTERMKKNEMGESMETIPLFWKSLFLSDSLCSIDRRSIENTFGRN